MAFKINSNILIWSLFDSLQKAMNLLLFEEFSILIADKVISEKEEDLEDFDDNQLKLIFLSHEQIEGNANKKSVNFQKRFQTSPILQGLSHKKRKIFQNNLNQIY